MPLAAHPPNRLVVSTLPANYRRSQDAVKTATVYFVSLPSRLLVYISSLADKRKSTNLLAQIETLEKNVLEQSLTRNLAIATSNLTKDISSLVYCLTMFDVCHMFVLKYYLRPIFNSF